MAEMELIKFVRQKLRGLFRVELTVVGENGEIPEELGETEFDPAIALLRLSDKTEDPQHAVPEIPTLIAAEENVYLGYFALPDRQVCIIGPMGGELLTKDQQWKFQIHFRVSKEGYEIPKFIYTQALEIVETAFLLLTGKMTHIMKEDETLDEGALEHDVLHHRLDNETEERARSSYASERDFFQIIENGDTEKMLHLMYPADGGDRDDSIRKVGSVAKNSDFKQAEYTAVTGIALASRAAIWGNARPDACYDLSDLFLQKISVAGKIEEIYELSRQALIQFTKEVEKERKRRIQNPVVERCKNYIAKHLYSRLSVQQMADDLGMNRTYLSGIFRRETGVTIQDYIMEHRVRAAANMLRFSTEPIGQIAEYLQFSSAGRFSEYFRRYYQMTPEQYRRENQLSEFSG